MKWRVANVLSFKIGTPYGSLDVQLGYKVRSLTRIAIQMAYGIVQRRMLIAGTAIMVLSLIWVSLIKNYIVAKMQQVKGPYVPITNDTVRRMCFWFMIDL